MTTVATATMTSQRRQLRPLLLLRGGWAATARGCPHSVQKGVPGSELAPQMGHVSAIAFTLLSAVLV